MSSKDIPHVPLCNAQRAIINMEPFDAPFVGLRRHHVLTELTYTMYSVHMKYALVFVYEINLGEWFGSESMKDRDYILPQDTEVQWLPCYNLNLLYTLGSYAEYCAARMAGVWE